jgi:O-antigen/teichoic acid export membrane protein
LIVSGLKIGLIILFINQFNIFGVIAASLISIMIEIVLLRTNLRNKFQFKFNLFKMVVAPVILLGLIIFMEPTLGTKFPLAVHAFYLVSCAALLWWGYRNEVRLINPLARR